jgi:hypothetical protein
MTKTLLEYIQDLEKHYEFRIKMLFEPSKEGLDSLEKHLEKYEIIKCSHLQKSMFLKHAIGWTEPVNQEIWFVDVELSLPVTPQQLQHEIATLFEVNINQVAVLTDEQLEMTDAMTDTQADPTSLNDSDFDYDHTELYGDEYNKKMIADIKKQSLLAVDTIFKKNTK